MKCFCARREQSKFESSVVRMEPINFFNAVAYLEPKCPRCAQKIEYGLTTEWSEKDQAHICKSCHAVLR